jgi:hypothetical protein
MPCPGPGVRAWLPKHWFDPCIRACVVIEHSMDPDHAVHSMYTASLFRQLCSPPYRISPLRSRRAPALFFATLPRFFAVVSNTSVSFPSFLLAFSPAVAFSPLCGGRVALISTAGRGLEENHLLYITCQPRRSPNRPQGIVTHIQGDLVVVTVQFGEFLNIKNVSDSAIIVCSHCSVLHAPSCYCDCIISVLACTSYPRITLDTLRSRLSSLSHPIVPLIDIIHHTTPCLSHPPQLTALQSPPFR